MPAHIPENRIRQVLAGILVLVAVEVALAFPEGTAFSFIAIAHADDDDDDGGDGRGGGGGFRTGGEGSGGSARSNGPNLLDRLFGKRPVRQPRARAARRVPSIPDRVPGEIVALGLDEPIIAELLQAGFAVDERVTIAVSAADLVKLQIPPGMTLDAARTLVAAQAPSATVDFNHLYRPEQGAAGVCGNGNCGLVRDLIGWPGAPVLACAASPHIGLVDTAINPAHASLAGSRLETIRIGDQDDAAPESSRQHGTAVAALLIGRPTSRAPGLLPDARLVAIDAFRRIGKSADRAAVYDLVRALDLLTTRNVSVVNLSLSGPSNTLLEKAVEAASNRGIVLVAAAGNDGPAAKPVYPAGYDRVIAVTAVDRGRTPYRRAVRGEHIDIAAPGVGVWTAASVSGARQKNGTSFAAPFVTAAAAILKATRPELTPQQVGEELMRAADDLGQPGKDPIYGWGLLNARTLCQAPAGMSR